MIGRGISWALAKTAGVCGLSGVRTMGAMSLRVGRWELSYGSTGRDDLTGEVDEAARSIASRYQADTCMWPDEPMSAQAADAWSRLKRDALADMQGSGAPFAERRADAAEFLEGILQALNMEADLFVEVGDTEGETRVMLCCADILEAKDDLLGVER